MAPQGRWARAWAGLMPAGDAAGPAAGPAERGRGRLVSLPEGLEAPPLQVGWVEADWGLVELAEERFFFSVT